MEAVNSITMFFLNGVKKVHAQHVSDGKQTLWESAKAARLAAGDPESPESEEKMKSAIAVGLLMSIAAICSDALCAINEAGRVLVKVGVPERAGPSDPEKLKEAAHAAALKLAGSLSVFEAMHKFAAEGLDVDHIVDVIFEEGKKAAAEKAAKGEKPKAVPITGTATPLSKRWEPSAN